MVKTAAAAAAALDSSASGIQYARESRNDKNTSGGGLNGITGYGGSRGGESRGRGRVRAGDIGAVEMERSTAIPLLHLRRVERKVVLGTGLLTLRSPGLSARRMICGDTGRVGVLKVGARGSTNGVGLGIGVPLRASSASTSRPSSARIPIASADANLSVVVDSTPFGSSNSRPIAARGRRGGGGETVGGPRTLSLVKAREVNSGVLSRMWSLLQNDSEPPQQLPPPQQQQQEQEQLPSTSSCRDRHRRKNDYNVLAPAELGPRSAPLDGREAIGATVDSVSVLEAATHPTVGNGLPFPRPPCRARDPLKGNWGGVEAEADPLPAFAAGLLPTRRSLPGAGVGEGSVNTGITAAARSRSLSSTAAHFRCHGSGGAPTALPTDESPLIDSATRCRVGNGSSRSKPCGIGAAVRPDFMADSRGFMGTTAAESVSKPASARDGAPLEKRAI